MVKEEMKSDAVTIRFHDEYYAKESQPHLSEAGMVVSGAYKRRLQKQPFLDLASLQR